MSIVVLVLGCRAQPAVVVPVAAEPTVPTTNTAPEPTPRASWCATEVVELLRDAEPKLGPTVGDRVAATDIVAVVKTEISRSDCTSVGHAHAIFVPVPGDGSGLTRAHFTTHLPAGLPPGSGYFLLGAAAVQPSTVDLNQVCIAWKGEVNARASWAVPLADEAEVALWQARLREGLCGRAPIAAPR